MPRGWTIEHHRPSLAVGGGICIRRDYPGQPLLDYLTTPGPVDVFEVGGRSGTITAEEYEQAMRDHNHHFGRAGIHAGPRPSLDHELIHSKPPPRPHYGYGHGVRTFQVGAPVSPAEACAMARMLRRHGFDVREPSMQVGAPVSAHDADAVVRILQDHGYQVSRRRGKRRSKRRRKGGGLLVGFARALTGGR